VLESPLIIGFSPSQSRNYSPHGLTLAQDPYDLASIYLNNLDQDAAPGHSQTILSPSTSDSLTNWYLDSGASHHLSPSLQNINSVSSYQGNLQVMVGNGKLLHIRHIGSKSLKSKHKTLNLNHVLQTFQIIKNLISVSKLCSDNDVLVEFGSNFFVVKDRKSFQPLLQGTHDQGLYRLLSSSSNSRFNSNRSYGFIYSVLVLTKLGQQTCSVYPINVVSSLIERPCFGSSDSVSDLFLKYFSVLSANVISIVKPNDVALWHAQLGHLSNAILSKIL